MPLRAVVLSSGVAVCVTPVFASVSLLDTSRSLSWDASVSTIDEFDSDSDSAGPFTTPGAFSDSVSVEVFFTSGTLVQEGLVDSSGANVSTRFETTVRDEWFGATNSAARSEFRARWSITEPTPFSITMSAVYPTFGGTTGVFRPVGGAALVEVDPGIQREASASGVLAPGQYELVMLMNQDTDSDGLFPLGRGDRDVWSVDLQIPAPGSAAALGLAGVALMRRRR